MNRSSALSVLAVLLLVMCASCLEELENLDKLKSTTFKPRIEFPLINSEFTMKDFLTEGQSAARITERSGVMVLTYDDTIRTPNTFFFLPNQSESISVPGPSPFPNPGGSVTVSQPWQIDFSTTGQLLDSIQVKSGALTFTFDSDMPANISLTISIPSLKTNGTGYQQTFTLNGTTLQTSTRDLQGSTIDLTLNGTTTNKLMAQVTAVITDTGTSMANTSLDISFGIADLKFRGLYGDLGTQDFSLPLDSIDVDIFGNSVTASSFQLVAPSIQLDINNSFGLPAGFNIQNMGSIKNDGTTITLSGAAVSSPANPYLLAAPANNEVGQSANTSIALNTGNSNLSQILSQLPRYLTYKFGFRLNPTGQTKNFVLDDSKLDIGVHLDLPFHGSFSALTITKNYEFAGLGIDELADSKVVVKTTNETPLEAQVQAYFLDSNGNVLETLFINPAILDGAPVNGSAETQGTSSVITTVTLTDEKIDRMNQATTLQIVATLFTTDAGSVPVKFSAIDKLKVSIGVNTQVEYKVN
jgi:hypothetical protein